MYKSRCIPYTVIYKMKIIYLREVLLWMNRENRSIRIM